jgi:hypothetical protein
MASGQEVRRMAVDKHPSWVPEGPEVGSGCQLCIATVVSKISWRVKIFYFGGGYNFSCVVKSQV